MGDVSRGIIFGNQNMPFLWQNPSEELTSSFCGRWSPRGPTEDRQEVCSEDGQRAGAENADETWIRSVRFSKKIVLEVKSLRMGSNCITCLLLVIGFVMLTFGFLQFRSQSRQFRTGALGHPRTGQSLLCLVMLDRDIRHISIQLAGKKALSVEQSFLFFLGLMVDFTWTLLHPATFCYFSWFLRAFESWSFKSLFQDAKQRFVNLKRIEQRPGLMSRGLRILRAFPPA